jgi:hypothetical protein
MQPSAARAKTAECVALRSLDVVDRSDRGIAIALVNLTAERSPKRSLARRSMLLLPFRMPSGGEDGALPCLL